MKEYATGNETLKKYEGELCFLRAFIALQLVRNWGDVPYKTTYTASVSDAYSPRVDRELIYDQIMSDLEIARTQLPWADANTSPERATQGAARALTMRALLQRAGYSLKADAKLSRPSEAKRKEYFNAILTEWEAFKKSGFHNFYSGGYEQAWKNYCQNVDEPVETLWEIAFYTPDGKAPGAGMWGTYIGPSTDQASIYGRANSFFVVLPTWASFYDENDIRLDVNICQYKIDNKSQKVYNIKPYDPKKPATSPDTPSNKFYYPGKWRREWIGVGMSKDPNNTDVDYAVLRYPDVVLMVAEAMNELDRTDEAVELLNMVRKRAGITELKKDFSNYAMIYKAPKVIDLDFIDDSTPAGKFRTALYWERGFELCYEGTRKYDLIRWGILKESLENMYAYMKSTEKFPDGDPKKYKYALNAFPAGKGDRFVTGKHELFPIPLMEIQRNKALGSLNNPGY
ncbi:RagB/SusD family nutrient uptake outer membrane protein [Bacteroides nordii]|nr:RagB/SusD family nutrient uptake outer membrane protein [Bacteroides nordii]MBD9108728.1 RagB/SusD family nutrient uptake outer membrane protein [Bacteroides nordii]